MPLFDDRGVVVVAEDLVRELDAVALDDAVNVPDGAELALLPPFSGGSAVSATRRRGHLLLLGGSGPLPAMLALGAVAGRWVLGLRVRVRAGRGTS